ncbi:hypothetical protein P7K49_013490 [Saguinus oedipus]|uniref:Uncharacterized protein n=1 Tax=Saguinus oedipus TaxID=9490 RepID=A0ABQ9VGL0_SAGOE|nr:hypothetical protein P7K49_013490 [Saguinus oedipus]
MVKISFQPAVAGIKGNKADKASASVPVPAPATEILLTPARGDPGARSRRETQARPEHQAVGRGTGEGAGPKKFEECWWGSVPQDVLLAFTGIDRSESDEMEISQNRRGCASGRRGSETGRPHPTPRPACPGILGPRALCAPPPGFLCLPSGLGREGISANAWQAGTGREGQLA